ncbi:MAG: substrate-binding domain-containing protein [ANME-2 cluster archaeon]|nr:substrate-binding domain-containing protein [ANME-2 cluster archaeon]
MASAYATTVSFTPYLNATTTANLQASGPRNTEKILVLISMVSMASRITMNKYFRILALVVITSFTFGCTGQQPVESLDIKGSDTLVQLVADIAQTYMENNQGTDVLVTGGGSGTGIAALINGEIDIAISSRSITTT